MGLRPERGPVGELRAQPPWLFAPLRGCLRRNNGPNFWPLREITLPLQMVWRPCRRGCRNGGIGRHEGLKIPWPEMAVRVRVPLAAQTNNRQTLQTRNNTAKTDTIMHFAETKAARDG